MTTEDERQLLQLIYTLKHPTTAQLHLFAYRHLSKRSVELRLEALRTRRLIDVHLLYPEQGARSPRYYHLLAAGAREIGLKRLGSNHYRVERREYFHARSARQELDFLAKRHGWALYTKEQACREILTAFLIARGKQQYDEAFPAHTLLGLLPQKVRPDGVLVTQQEVIVCIFAHPHASRAFWHERAKRYGPLLQRLRAVAILLSEEQRQGCEEALTREGLSGRILSLLFNELAVLEERLGKKRE